MRTVFITFIISLLLNFQFVMTKTGFPAPFGKSQKIIKIRELPDQPAFQIKDGTYYDIGCIYEVKRFLWLGYSFGDTEYVGYIDSQEKYVPLTAQELKNSTAKAKIKLTEKAKISFFDFYISRVLLLMVIVFIVFFSYTFYIQKKKMLKAQNQKELPSWPPN